MGIFYTFGAASRRVVFTSAQRSVLIPMIKNIFAAIIVSALVASGCKSNEVANSGDVAQHTIHQQYSVKYDEGTNETHVYAGFRFGGSNGTTLLLSKPSKVTFNGDSLTAYKGIVSGAYYGTAWSKPLPNGQQCSFIFKDTEDKTYTNTLKFNAILLTSVPKEVKTGLPLEIEMITAPFTFGEKIIVTVSDSSNSADYVMETLTGNKLVIPAATLKLLKDHITVEIRRYYSSQLKEATQEGGIITFEYKLKPVRVKIVQ
jgi:hypothetical protein